MNAEGWFLDPFELHTDRWFSDGTPTRLVRDEGVESYDPPPSTSYADPLVPSPESEPTDGSDLARADDAATNPDYQRAALDVWDQTAGLI